MYSPLKNFIGIFYAQGGPEYMNWGIPMWFLPALFITSIIDFIISKCPVLFRYILTFMITFAGFFLNKYLEYHLPWSIDIAFALYGFYFIGVVLRKLNFIDFLSNKWLSVLFTIVFCLIHLISFHNNGRILYYYGNYGYFPFMYLNGIAGFMWIFSLFSLIPKSKIIVWVGQNTLPILAFHLLAMTLIKGVFYFILNVQIQFDVILSLVYGILQITILVPFILLLNQHFPFLVGNKKKKHFDLNHDKD
jgi:fucose 4-O-acetylase-like acetyltransferase